MIGKIAEQLRASFRNGAFHQSKGKRGDRHSRWGSESPVGSDSNAVLNGNGGEGWKGKQQEAARDRPEPKAAAVRLGRAISATYPHREGEV